MKTVFLTLVLLIAGERSFAQSAMTLAGAAFTGDVDTVLKQVLDGAELIRILV